MTRRLLVEVDAGSWNCGNCVLLSEGETEGWWCDVTMARVDGPSGELTRTRKCIESEWAAHDLEQRALDLGREK